jgi:hypothetical protein
VVTRLEVRVAASNQGQQSSRDQAALAFIGSKTRHLAISIASEMYVVGEVAGVQPVHRFDH